MEAWNFEYVIRDADGEVIICREVDFPYPIDSDRLDLVIAEIFLRLHDEKDVKKAN